MKQYLLVVLFILKFSFSVDGQLAINHNGVSVFSSTDYLGAREHIENGSVNTFVIQSIKIWPGYSARLYNSQDSRSRYFTSSTTVVDANDHFDIVVSLPGGDPVAPPAYSGPFYCIVTGGASARMKAYVDAGVHNVEEELGGSISSIECALG